MKPFNVRNFIFCLSVFMILFGTMSFIFEPREFGVLLVISGEVLFFSNLAEFIMTNKKD